MPGLGTFTSRHRSATIEADGSVTAPGYDIAFAPGDEGLDDEALVGSVARAMSIDKAAARSIIDGDIDDMRRELQANGAIHFGDMGRLCSLDDSSRFDCPAWSGGVIALDDFIPSTLMAESRPVRAESVEVAQTPTEEQRSRRSAFIRSLERTASSAAAVVVLALITFVLGQLPDHRDHGTTNASLSLEASRTALPLPAAPAAAEPTLVLVFNTPADGVCDVEPTPAPVTDNYCLVVASLASQAEAREYIGSNRQLNLLEKDGRFRVYALTGASYAELSSRARVEGLFDLYPSAWICRM